jgi:hypothetical protein
MALRLHCLPVCFERALHWIAGTLGMWFETIHRVAEVHWTDADCGDVNPCLVSQSLGYVADKRDEGCTCLGFDISPTHLSRRTAQQP